MREDALLAACVTGAILWISVAWLGIVVWRMKREIARDCAMLERMDRCIDALKAKEKGIIYLTP